MANESTHLLRFAGEVQLPVIILPSLCQHLNNFVHSGKKPFYDVKKKLGPNCEKSIAYESELE